ncbi:MAG TPA: hypothetical protein VFX84_03465 [Candidatus Saccharimonadales bacterium]|nr:hypothetical protein [Candidatus Saccharimonadales bacterium]
MAEHAPTPTPNNGNQAPPLPSPEEREASRRDLKVTATFGHLDPDARAAALTEKLQADATLRGHEDLQGLDLTIHDDDGFTQRYIVTHSAERQVDKPVEGVPKNFWPSIQGSVLRSPRSVSEERAKEGRPSVAFPRLNRGAIARDTERRTHRNVGLPRPVKRGSSWNIEFGRQEARNPVYTPLVTVNVYNMYDELTETRTMHMDEFYEEAGEALAGGGGDKEPMAVWNFGGRESGSSKVENPDHMLEIGLTRGNKPAFRDIQDQLEAKGVTNWTGLRWQLDMPGADVYPVTHGHRKGEDSNKHHVGVRTRDQEILSDVVVKEPGETGTDERYARIFTLRTTERYQDGSTNVVSEEQLRDYELWHYLEEPDKFKMDESAEHHRKIAPKDSVITNVRMPEALAPYHGDKLREGLVRAWADGEHAMSQGRINPPELTVDDMLGVLCRPEFYPNTDEGRARLHEDIESLKGTVQEAYAQELLGVIQSIGSDAFNEIVKNIHDAYTQDLKRLGVEESAVDVSPNWVIEPLMEKALEYTNRYSGDARLGFYSALGNPESVRGIIDEQVGIMFELSTIKVNRRVVPDGVDDDGRPQTKEQVMHDFNKDVFETLSIHGSPSNTDKIKKWRDRIWGSRESRTDLKQEPGIQEVARDIYDRYVASQDITPEEFRLLGRKLRRTIGE